MDNIEQRVKKIVAEQLGVAESRTRSCARPQAPCAGSNA